MAGDKSEVAVTNPSELHDINKYRSPMSWEPKQARAKQKCFDMYQDYLLGSLTIQQIAKKWDVSHFHAGRCIKWATFQSEGAMDKNAYRQETIDRLRVKFQELEKKLLSLEKNTNLKEEDKLSLFLRFHQEMRLTLKLEASANQVLAPENMVGQAAANITINVPNLNRGTGVEEAITVEPAG